MFVIWDEGTQSCDMSIQKLILFSAGKLKERKISRPLLLSLIKDGND